MKRKLQLSLVDSKYNDSYPFNRNDRETNLFVTEVLSESSKLLGSAPLPLPPPPFFPFPGCSSAVCSMFILQPNCTVYFSLPVCPALAPDQSEVLSPKIECPRLEKCFDPHCKEKSGQHTCDGIVSCYWCERDKDDVILPKPYCDSYEQCFRGKETPAIKGKSKII